MRTVTHLCKERNLSLIEKKTLKMEKGVRCSAKREESIIENGTGEIQRKSSKQAAKDEEDALIGRAKRKGELQYDTKGSRLIGAQPAKKDTEKAEEKLSEKQLILPRGVPDKAAGGDHPGFSRTLAAQPSKSGKTFELGGEGQRTLMSQLRERG